MYSKKSVVSSRKAGIIDTSEQLSELSWFDHQSYIVSKAIEGKYPIRIPRFYLDLADFNNPDCPILKQCIPSEKEDLRQKEGFLDPIDDNAHEKKPGLLHKYHNRLLVIATRECFLYCRFCFRKNFGIQGTTANCEDACNYLIKHPEINEVILSGGDPLFLSNQVLNDWFSHIGKVGSVRRVRIHTRSPVAYPQRFDDRLYTLLQKTSFPVILSIHINHPKELTPECKEILVRLRKMGVVTVSQTVLLKGVNDSAMILRRLFDDLMSQGCTPYYLHHCDKVKGGMHFSLSLNQGVRILSSLWDEISGLSIPKYVVDIPGGRGKVPIDLRKMLNT